MKEFKDKVAVVTGAASGIGRAMSDRFAAEGMKIVLADVDEGALAAAEREMQAGGATVIAVPTDVSKAEDVEALAIRTRDTFGIPHIVCNNAGVAPPFGSMWERSLADWEWVLGINLWGVIHGLRVFVPLMLEQSEGHIVNTASSAGITSGPAFAIYYAAKHGVVSLSESLHHELALASSKLKVSVLCPSWVTTQILDSDRNRPGHLANPPSEQPNDRGSAALDQMARQALASGIGAGEVAEHVLQAIKDEKLYIITHADTKDQVRIRMEDMVEGRNPVFQPIF